MALFGALSLAAGILGFVVLYKGRRRGQQEETKLSDRSAPAPNVIPPP